MVSMNSTTITNSSQCHEELSTPSDISKTILLILYILTIPVYALVAKMIHDVVDVAHPVFAMAFQDVVVLCVYMIFDVLCLMSIFVGYKLDTARVFYHIFQAAAIQFHQWTWLIITCLR